MAGDDPRAQQALAPVSEPEQSPIELQQAGVARLPFRVGLGRGIVAGLASLVVPGLGQLINLTFVRAALLMTIWAGSLLVHLSPLWTFVALFAAAEAFFTGKLRGMEQELARAARQPR